MMDVISQVMIAVFGLGGIWLSQDAREERRRCACLLGMASQPFWLWATLSSDQWGMFALSICYTAAWAKGINTHWLRPWREERLNRLTENR